MISKKLIITGKVQGVFFRKNTKQKANILGITGTVQNMPDGSVHIIATGGEIAMEQFIGWCKKGPDKAVVENVQVIPIDRATKSDQFEII